MRFDIDPMAKKYADRFKRDIDTQQPSLERFHKKIRSIQGLEPELINLVGSRVWHPVIEEYFRGTPAITVGSPPLYFERTSLGIGIEKAIEYSGSPDTKAPSLFEIPYLVFADPFAIAREIGAAGRRAGISELYLIMLSEKQLEELRYLTS